MALDLVELGVSIVLIVISVAVTFYLKDYLQRRSESSALKAKLVGIAGKNAMVLYSPGPGANVGMGPQLFKITAVDKQGVTLSNELQSIFIPTTKLIQSDLILPGDRFEAAKREKMKKDFEEIADAMFPALFEKMLPALKEALGEELEGEGEFAALIGVKIQKVLKEEGYEIKKQKED